jgi:hypothetical protein
MKHQDDAIPSDFDEQRQQIRRLKDHLRATQIVVVIVAMFSALDYLLPGGFGKVSATYSGGGGRLVASVEKDTAGITMRSSDGALRGLFVEKAESDVALLLFDPQGTPRAEMSVQAAGPGIRLRDSHGTLRMELSVESGECRMSMFDGFGDVLWSAP